MEPRVVSCLTCGKEFEIINPRSRQVFCSPSCRPERKPVDIVERPCGTCGNVFKPTYDCQQYCSKPCRGAAISKSKKLEHEPTECQTCGVSFVPKKKGKKYCTHECYAKRHAAVDLVCQVCSKAFTVAYRFRGQKSCSRECGAVLTGQAHYKRVPINCLCCDNVFYVVPSYKDDAKYCSTDCSYKHRFQRDSMTVTLTCENCGIEFEKPFIERNRRFCGYSCANTGESNGMFGVTGPEHPRYGVPSWSAGLTAETDPRLAALGEKISIIVADKIVSGTWSPPTTGYVGEHYTGVKNSGKTVYLRSSYESKYARKLDNDPVVIEWEHEPIRIPYMYEGRVRNYVPDFLVTRASARVELVEVKPELLTLVGKNEVKQHAAQCWCRNNGVVYVCASEEALCP